MKAFGERLKELRNEHNLTAKQLGNILKVRDTTILRWEKGIIVPGINHLINIAIYFKVTPNYLLGFED